MRQRGADLRHPIALGQRQGLSTDQNGVPRPPQGQLVREILKVLATIPPAKQIDLFSDLDEDGESTEG